MDCLDKPSSRQVEAMSVNSDWKDGEQRSLAPTQRTGRDELGEESRMGWENGCDDGDGIGLCEWKEK